MWDKYAAATNMVCMEYNPFHQDEDGNIIPMFRMLFRIEIPRSEWTYVNVMNKIIELNDEYKFDWIGIDRGYCDACFLGHRHKNDSEKEWRV